MCVCVVYAKYCVGFVFARACTINSHPSFMQMEWVRAGARENYTLDIKCFACECVFVGNTAFILYMHV